MKLIFFLLIFCFLKFRLKKYKFSLYISIPMNILTSRDNRIKNLSSWDEAILLNNNKRRKHEEQPRS